MLPKKCCHCGEGVNRKNYTEYVTFGGADGAYSGAWSASPWEAGAQPTPDLLAERESTHGDYHTNSLIAQGLKHVTAEHRSELSAAQCESLDLICTKIARILSGNPNEPDHWRDIEGYARLITRELEK